MYEYLCILHWIPTGSLPDWTSLWGFKIVPECDALSLCTQLKAKEEESTRLAFPFSASFQPRLD